MTVRPAFGRVWPGFTRAKTMKSAESIFASMAEESETTSRTPSIPWRDKDALSLLGEMRKHKAKEADAKAAKELVVAKIKPMAVKFWVASNRGVATPIDRLEVEDGSISFADVYGTSKEAQAVVETLPEDLLRSVVDIAIDGDLIPDHCAAKFAAEIKALRDKYGLKSAFKITLKRRPVLDFAIKRHSVLTPEQNLDFEAKGLGTRITIK